MKVVIVAGSLHTEGGSKVMAQIANALTVQGHEVEVVVLSHALVNYEIYGKLTRIPMLTKEFIPYGDIVLSSFYHTFLPAYEAWPNQCVRLSQIFEPYFVKNKELALSTFTQGVPIITISRWIDDQIFNHVGQRTYVVNCGIESEIFHVGQRRRIYKDRRKVIAYLARDPEKGYGIKGFYDFVKSMQIFKRIYKGKFIVHMVCPETKLTLPGIPYKVFFKKFPDPSFMARLYRSADVFVSTSWNEGFGLPLLEAMACGTPVVSTNSGGILDFCEHRTSGFIVNPRDPEAIARGIKRVLTRKRLRRRLIKGGLASASIFTVENFQNNLVAVLENIYNERNFNETADQETNDHEITTFEIKNQEVENLD